MKQIVQSINMCVSPVEYETWEELINIPWIKEWEKKPNFKEFRRQTILYMLKPPHYNGFYKEDTENKYVIFDSNHVIDAVFTTKSKLPNFIYAPPFDKEGIEDTVTIGYLLSENHSRKEVIDKK